uniref:Uncharacterized protein n=1 Tax=Pseudonaja textilis TaxID=8673 RepID=A0A670YIV7_PSETE
MTTNGSFKHLDPAPRGSILACNRLRRPPGRDSSLRIFILASNLWARPAEAQTKGCRQRLERRVLARSSQGK